MEFFLFCIVICVVGVVVANKLRSPSVRGKIGEAKIASRLDRINFFGYKGHSLRNVYIPRADGKTSEIDLLYITTKGIFVIESKNYSGYIFGNDKQQNWTSTLYGGKTWYGGRIVNKYKFYNPIWQNNTHIKALKEYVGDVATFSFIVFGDDCELVDVSFGAGDIWVCHEYELSGIMKKVLNSSDELYDEQTVERIYSKLLSCTNVSEEVKQGHISDIHNAQTSDICPRCGGKLVLRTAKKGANSGNQFYGCSNYPKCKYTKNYQGV